MILYTALINLPSADSIIATTSPYAQMMFDSLIPIAAVILGFFIGAFVVMFIINSLLNILDRFRSG